jgi:hypothetical protein
LKLYEKRLPLHTVIRSLSENLGLASQYYKYSSDAALAVFFKYTKKYSAWQVQWAIAPHQKV